MSRSKNSALQPVVRLGPLGDRVYEMLRNYLRSGHVRWGEFLREETLAERLGVSRTPVREALRRLASEGLVEAHGRSFAVPALTEDDLEDIYELRLLLETEAVRQVASRQDAEERLVEVRRALQQTETAHTRGDAEGFIAGNSRFRAAPCCRRPAESTMARTPPEAQRRALGIQVPSLRGRTKRKFLLFDREENWTWHFCHAA